LPGAIESGRDCGGPRSGLSVGHYGGASDLLADDDELVRRGLRQLLQQRDGWEVCGEAVTGRQAVEMASRLIPNVVVLDLTMPELNGLEAIRQIRGSQPFTEVLALTGRTFQPLIREAFAAGARGYLRKSATAAQVVSAVETIAKHKHFFSSEVIEIVLACYLRQLNARQNRRADPLTPREREIVQLLAEGNSNRRIAGLLEISLKTVETHRATILRKLNAHSIVDIVRYALRNKLAGI
jgi:DNA-binding NarL/FixJ family response regulator